LIPSLLAVRLSSGTEKCPTQDHTTIADLDVTRSKKQEFQRLIAKLKRLALKKGYSQAQIASEVGVSIITVNNWLTGHSLMAQRKKIDRLKKFLAAH
jgi:DNA-binding XRE family transcriptional regulator